MTTPTKVKWQNIDTTDSINSGLIWEIKIWSTDTAPSNWLICDWAAISRTTYASLFAIIGETYWVGNGTTTFNIPDLKGRVVVGKSTDTEFDTLGETGWVKDVTLDSTMIPSHTHNLQYNPATSGDYSWYSYWTYPLTWYNASWSDDADNRTEATPKSWNRWAFRMESVWWWAAHSNLQPYLTLNYIIKY